jgi:hypothetical protein
VCIVGIGEERDFGKDRRHVGADENDEGSLFDSTSLRTLVALLQGRYRETAAHIDRELARFFNLVLEGDLLYQIGRFRILISACKMLRIIESVFLHLAAATITNIRQPFAGSADAGGLVRSEWLAGDAEVMLKMARSLPNCRHSQVTRIASHNVCFAAHDRSASALKQ